VSEAKEIERLSNSIVFGNPDHDEIADIAQEALALARRLLAENTEILKQLETNIRSLGERNRRIASLARQHAAIRLEQAEKMVSIWTNETSPHRNGLGLIAERDRLKREVTRDSEKREVDE